MKDDTWIGTWDALSRLEKILDDGDAARKLLADRIGSGLLSATAECLTIWGRAGRFTFYTQDEDFAHELDRELTKHASYVIEWRVGTFERNSIVHGAKIVGLRICQKMLESLCTSLGERSSPSLKRFSDKDLADWASEAVAKGYGVRDATVALNELWPSHLVRPKRQEDAYPALRRAKDLSGQHSGPGRPRKNVS